MQVGEVLIRRGQLRIVQLDFMLQLQKAYASVGRDLQLGALLLSHRMVSEHALSEALAVQADLPEETITLILEALKEMPSRITGVLPEALLGR